MTNQEQLRSIIAHESLSRSALAALMGVSIHTVNAWLLPDTCKAHRDMPDKMLKLLTLTLRYETG